VSRLKAILERFADALSCIDQCFIADEMLEQLPLPTQVGKTFVGGIDLNKARMRHVVEALIAFSPSPNGFTASDLAARVRASSKQTPLQYGPRHAAYDLKKLRGKQIIRRIGHTRRYEPLRTGLRAMTALVVLRNNAIKPLLAAAQPLHPMRGPHNPRPIDSHYQPYKLQCKASSMSSDSPLDIHNFFVGLRPEVPMGHLLVPSSNPSPSSGESANFRFLVSINPPNLWRITDNRCPVN
jgi:hypothetical protein